MKYYLKLGLILFIFCAVASGILAYVNSLTAPVIAQRKANDEVEARQKLIPGASFSENTTADGFSFFTATDPETEELKGYVFIAAETGYSSKVQTMVGIDSSFEVLGIKVLDQSETPGLGANCVNPSFTEQFTGLSLDELMVNKDGGKVVALSGATITSRAIANSMREAILSVQKHLAEGAEQ